MSDPHSTPVSAGKTFSDGATIARFADAVKAGDMVQVRSMLAIVAMAMTHTQRPRSDETSH